MSLLELLKNSAIELSEKSAQQIIAFAGKGKLLDGSECSSEFREFLNHIDSQMLAKIANQCLEKSFSDSGEALQDVVNELGRRLGFEVENGRYRGSQRDVGFDGIWQSNDGQSIVVEVKTSDVYQIKLDTIAEYRKRLAANGRLKLETSSVLVVVGRINTDALEAQIRGSRHSWDIRLISVESLLRLLMLKEDTDDPDLHSRISNILVPQEYTRLDGIVDLAFATAEDVQSFTKVVDDEGQAEGDSDDEVSSERSTPPAQFHAECQKLIADHLKVSLVRKSRVIFKSPEGDLWLSCAVSREYKKSDERSGFWYAFHPHQREQLKAAKQAYVAFGCGSSSLIVLIPFNDFDPWLEGCNVTKREGGRTYWHIHLYRDGDRLTLRQKGERSNIDLTKYVLR